MSTLDELTDIVYELFLRDFADHNPQQFCIQLNPVPASRPRVFKSGGVTYGKNYNAYKEQAVGPCRLFTRRKTGKPIACLLEHLVKVPTRKHDIWPNGDLDNYDKGPLDAMVKSGCFWQDDVQVMFMISVKRFAKDNETPCVNVTWFDFEI